MSKLLLYCTKAKPYLYRQDDDTFKLENKIVDEDISDYKKYYGLNNGKIVSECDYEVEELTNCGTSFMIMKYDDLRESYRYTNKIARCSCLDYTDLKRYLGENNGYAIHIKNLTIFDKPKELNEYCRYNRPVFDKNDVVEKAPQNMCRVLTKNGYEYILISIQPQWMCLILNRIKDVEVRKKVLKEMLKNE